MIKKWKLNKLRVIGGYSFVLISALFLIVSLHFYRIRFSTEDYGIPGQRFNTVITVVGILIGLVLSASMIQGSINLAKEGIFHLGPKKRHWTFLRNIFFWIVLLISFIFFLLIRKYFFCLLAFFYFSRAFANVIGYSFLERYYGKKIYIIFDDVKNGTLNQKKNIDN